MFTKTLYFAVITAFIVGASCDVTFFEHINFDGARFDRTASSLVSCLTLPSEWQNRISSINTHGRQIRAYEHNECEGHYENIGPGTCHHRNLVNLEFNDRISSVKLCESLQCSLLEIQG